MNKKKNKKGVARLTTEQLLQQAVEQKVAEVESLYQKKREEEKQILHNRIVEVIEEVKAKPDVVVFVLELLKAEILEQYLKSVVRGVDNGV